MVSIVYSIHLSVFLLLIVANTWIHRQFPLVDSVEIYSAKRCSACTQKRAEREWEGGIRETQNRKLTRVFSVIFP